MAGKRVRCKQCGNIFSLPDSPDDEMSDGMQALAELEKSFHSADATSAGEDSPPASGESSEETPPEEEENYSGDFYGRSNVRFRYPFAKEIDLWLPPALIVLSLIWLITQSINANETSIRWLPWLRIGVALFCFSVLIAPLTLALIRYAGRRFKFQMPSNDRRRAYAIYLFAFVMGYALWIAGDGQIPALLLGSFAGVALASAALWLLFRLYPTEIAPTAGFSAIGFFLGLGISIGLVFVGNLVVIQTLLAMKSPDSLPASPFGPHLPWITADQRNALTAGNNPKSPVPSPSNPPRTSPTPAATENRDAVPVRQSSLTPAEVSPVVKSLEIAPLKEAFDQIIYPLTDSGFRAFQHASGSNTIIDLRDAQTWAQRASASFATAPEVSGNRYVLSPDGKFVAHIATFPRLSAQVWSFADRNVAYVLPLSDEKLTDPELVGFVDSQKLIVRWQRPGGYGLDIRDLTSNQRIRLIEVPRYELDATAICVSPKGNLVAIAAAVGNKPSLLIYGLETGKEVPPVVIGSLDPRWPVKPTGMAITADSSKLGIIFEQDGNALLLAYQIDADLAKITQVAERIYPAGSMPTRSSQYSGSSLSWLPDGKSCLLYGQGIFDIATGRRIAELRLNNVQTCRASVPNLVEITAIPDDVRQVISLRLDMDKLASLPR